MSTTADNTKPVLCPPFVIETRIVFVDRDQRIEIPLGTQHAGRWCTYDFREDENSLELTMEQLVNWLTKSDWFGIPYFDEEEARSIAEETIQRCRALAECVQNGEAENA